MEIHGKDFRNQHKSERKNDYEFFTQLLLKTQIRKKDTTEGVPLKTDSVCLRENGKTSISGIMVQLQFKVKADHIGLWLVMFIFHR